MHDEAGCFPRGNLHLQSEHHGLLQGRESEHEYGHQDEASNNGGEQPRSSYLADYLVDEDRGENGRHNARERQENSDRNDERQRAMGLAHHASEAPGEADRWLGAMLQLRSAREHESDTAVARLKFRWGDLALPRSRVVDESAPARETFENHEVTLPPKHDARHLLLREFVDVETPPTGIESVMASSVHECKGVCAIARDSACHPQLLERYPAAEVGKDHCKTCRAALNLFHLDNARHFDDGA